MIVGHGIDLQDIKAIERAHAKNIRVSQKVLTAKEFERYQVCKDDDSWNIWLVVGLSKHFLRH